MWTIIFGHSLTSVLDVTKLREEVVHLRRSLRARAGMGEEVAIKGVEWMEEVSSRY